MSDDPRTEVRPFELPTRKLERISGFSGQMRPRRLLKEMQQTPATPEHLAALDEAKRMLG